MPTGIARPGLSCQADDARSAAKASNATTLRAQARMRNALAPQVFLVMDSPGTDRTAPGYVCWHHGKTWSHANGMGESGLEAELSWEAGGGIDPHKDGVC